MNEKDYLRVVFFCFIKEVTLRHSMNLNKPHFNKGYDLFICNFTTFITFAPQFLM
jgi:hypothetical protein